MRSPVPARWTPSGGTACASRRSTGAGSRHASVSTRRWCASSTRAIRRASHVVVTYVKGGRLYRVRARKVVMAGGSWTTKHIVRDLPAAHREAYAQFHRSPCLMANVAVRNWRFLYKMGMSGCRWFEGLGNYTSVRKMAIIGSDSPTISPDSPTVLTIKVLFAEPGLPIAEQGSKGRAQMLGTSFAEYERSFREQLGDMFA